MRSNRPARRIAGAGAVLCALLAWPAGVQAESGRLVLDSDLSLGYDSNVSNAEHDNDIRSSRFAIAGLRVDNTTRISDQASLLLRGGLQAEAHDDLDGLNNGKFTGLVRFIYRPEGFHDQAWSFWGSAARWEFSSRLRDSSEYRVGIFLVDRFTPGLSGRLSVSASRRQADDSNVFDLGSASVGAGLDWAVTPVLTVYGSTQFHDGDVVSTATASPGILAAADARAPDDVLRNRIAYRLDAETWIHTLGFNYGLSRTLSLDAQTQYVDADAVGGNNYQRWIAIGGVLARF